MRTLIADPQRVAKETCCPFCKRAVLMEDDTQTIHHEKPICDAFKQKMQTFGLQTVQTGELAWKVDE